MKVSSTYAEIWYDRDQFESWFVSFFEPDGTPSDRESEPYAYKNDAARRAARLKADGEICRYAVFTRSGELERVR